MTHTTQPSRSGVDSGSTGSPTKRKLNAPTAIAANPAIAVARRYFIERQTKKEIGKDLSILRFKVVRLIDEAIEEGLVRFEIDDAGELDAGLSDSLREKYSLRNALVLLGP